MKHWLKSNWSSLLLPAMALATMLWAGGCPPRAPSPINPTEKLTLQQLNAELEHLIQKYEIAAADIEEQQRIRTLILQNALLIAETGTLNPLALITALAGAYGISRAGTDTIRTIKKKRAPPSPS